MAQGMTLEKQAEGGLANPARSQGWLKQRKFLIGGFIILLAVGYLVFSSMEGAMVYYLTTSELLGRGEEAYGQQVRLAGQVADGSVQHDTKNMTLRFAVLDEANQQIPLVYKGVVPDAFKDGGDVVVEGKLGPDGMFQGSALLVKCPSKYSSENK